MIVESTALDERALGPVRHAEDLTLRECSDVMETAYWFQRMTKLRRLTIDSCTFDEETGEAMGTHLKNIGTVVHLTIRGPFAKTMACFYLLQHLSSVPRLTVSWITKLGLPIDVQQLHYTGKKTLTPDITYIRPAVRMLKSVHTHIPGTGYCYSLEKLDGVYGPDLRLGRNVTNLILRNIDASDLALASDIRRASIKPNGLVLTFLPCTQEALLLFLGKMGTCAYLDDPIGRITYDLEDRMEFEDEENTTKEDLMVSEVLMRNLHDRPLRAVRMAKRLGVDETRHMIEKSYI